MNYTIELHNLVKQSYTKEFMYFMLDDKLYFAHSDIDEAIAIFPCVPGQKFRDWDDENEESIDYDACVYYSRNYDVSLYKHVFDFINKRIQK